ncbi:ATP-binding protein [Sediminibacillus albus]|uniref:histidine kinase n=1 Tax=Sediminibacillus albus TaxID=407036 RepID=A0A1G8VWG3_9BACI|nr:ATP-binding protein [Sediminibacillus albus]SDJ70339.1 two-component system, sporulation sensor kinase A [Sediminibacillus albus]
MDSEQTNKEVNLPLSHSQMELADHHHPATEFMLANLPNNMLKWVEQNGYDLITICDLKGRVLYVSDSVYKMLGYKSKDLIGVPVLELLSPYDQEMMMTKFSKQSGESQKFHLSIRNTDGKYIWAESVIGRVHDEERAFDVLISVTKDIQDKKEAEEMMIRSEKMSVAGQLAAGVAHEIRNPLTSIKGFLQLLQAGIDRKEEYYKIMVDEIEKIETITSELLFISKPMTDDKKKELLSELLSDVITLMKSQAKLKNVDICMDLDEKQYIYCDRSQIKQVFINLIKNAIEAMKDGGKVFVVADTHKDFCQIDIIDEGPGIPENLIHKLKEPFFTTKKDGTGLGLMISNQIVEKHNGSLEIYRNKEKGSTFRVIIPLKREY